MLEVGVSEVYYATAALFQLSLAGLVLSTGRVDAVRAGFALVLGFSGIFTALIVQSGQPPAWFDPWNRPFDGAIVWTSAFLLSQFPSPLGGSRGARVARTSWLAMLAGLYLLGAWKALSGAALPSPWGAVLHDTGFAAIGALFAVHVVPRFLELGPGPLRNQTLLAGSGLVTAAAFQGGSRLDNWIDPIDALETTLTSVTMAGLVVALLFVLLALARLAWSAWRTRDPGTLAVLGLVGLTVLLGVRKSLTARDVTDELATQILRPILLGFAMLRYDLFRVPARIRRTALPTVLVALGVVAFLLFGVLFTPGGLEAASMTPASAVLAVAAVAGLTFAGRGWLRESIPASLAAGAEGGERLERYRLALERVREGSGGPKELAGLRERLEVSPDEHTVLAHAVTRGTRLDVDQLRPARPGDRIGGRFEVDRELGTGGHGRALLAWDAETDRQVVLKELLRPWEADAEARRRRLEHEVEVAQGLDGVRGLATVHGLVPQEPHVYLVRDYVPGRALDQVVDEEGPLDGAALARVLGDVSRALEALHGRGLLHLDLKPQNIVLAEDGHAVIVDHGTVRKAEEADEDTDTETLGSDGPDVGTLAWMAPEQVLAEPVDARTDLFALGALAYHLATGRHHVALDGQAPFDVKDAIVRGTPPEDVPEPLEDLVEACLARDPDERPASAAAVRETLERVAAEARREGREP